MIEIYDGRVCLDNDFMIKEYYTNLGMIKILYNKDVPQSSSFKEEGKRNDIPDCYSLLFDLSVSINPNGKTCLLLGGGGFTYPKYYISKYNDKRMDVVEINGKCIEWAKKYFYLDELIKEYDSEEKKLNIIVDDAIKYINNCNKKYDYILVDLFDGMLPVEEIYNKDNLHNLKRCLNNGGVIMVNYIISNYNLYKYKNDLRNLVKIAKHYKIITNKYYFDTTKNTGNVLVLLSDCEINLLKKYSYMGINYIIN